MGLLENLGSRTVARLRTLEGSLRVLEELHEQLPRRRALPQEDLNEIFHRVYHLVGQANLTAIHGEVSDETARTLLAQVAIAFFVWEPLSLLVPGPEFERRHFAAVEVMRRFEDAGQSMGRNPLLLLKDSQPPHVVDEVIIHTALHTARRPLAFLLPTAACRGKLAPDALASLQFDGGIQERQSTTVHPLTGQESPRMLLLQCQPLPVSMHEVEQTLAATHIDFLRFKPEKVFASFAAGEHVLDHVRKSWNWQALEELSAQKGH